MPTRMDSEPSKKLKIVRFDSAPESGHPMSANALAMLQITPNAITLSVPDALPTSGSRTGLSIRSSPFASAR